MQLIHVCVVIIVISDHARRFKTRRARPELGQTLPYDLFHAGANGVVLGLDLAELCVGLRGISFLGFLSNVGLMSLLRCLRSIIAARAGALA